jgi:hypothetical protein
VVLPYIIVINTQIILGSEKPCHYFGNIAQQVNATYFSTVLQHFDFTGILKQFIEQANNLSILLLSSKGFCLFNIDKNQSRTSI